MHGTYSLMSHPKDKAKVSKCFAGHKFHDRDSNPRSTDQILQSLSSKLLTPQPQQFHKLKHYGSIIYLKCLHIKSQFDEELSSSRPKDPNTSDSDSDTTNVKEDRKPNQDKEPKLSANHRAGSSANQSVAAVRKGLPMKRAASTHDISDSDSGDDDGSSEEISQSLLTRKDEKSMDKKHLQFGSKGDSISSLIILWKE